jgi:hypothetical protein
MSTAIPLLPLWALRGLLQGELYLTYMFRVPAVPIIRNTILQSAVIGVTYITLNRETYGKVHFKSCPESGGVWK